MWYKVQDHIEPHEWQAQASADHSRTCIGEVSHIHLCTKSHLQSVNKGTLIRDHACHVQLSHQMLSHMQHLLHCHAISRQQEC